MNIYRSIMSSHMNTIFLVQMNFHPLFLKNPNSNHNVDVKLLVPQKFCLEIQFRSEDLYSILLTLKVSNVKLNCQPFKYCGYFSWTRLVRSPPSSRIMLRGSPSAKTNVCSMHQTYSSSVSPFQAYTGTSVLAIAAAAWSWVEKMLHDDHWTCKRKEKNSSYSHNAGKITV